MARLKMDGFGTAISGTSGNVVYADTPYGTVIRSRPAVNNPNTLDVPDDGMFSDGMLRAVACYEAVLGGESPPEGCKGGSARTTKTTGASTDAMTTTTTEP